MNQNPQQRQYLEGQNIDHEKIEIPGQREKNAADFPRTQNSCRKERSEADPYRLKTKNRLWIHQTLPMPRTEDLA